MEKRQPKREDGAAERSKAWREKKKNEGEPERTQANAEKRPDTDKDTDLGGSKELPPKSARTKISYPEEFNKFWQVFPKNGASKDESLKSTTEQSAKEQTMQPSTAVPEPIRTSFSVQEQNRARHNLAQSATVDH